MSKTRVVISGAAGRMGRRLVALGSEDSGMEIVAALDSESHPDAGKDAGLLAGVGELGLPITSSLTVEADAMIDFSVPAATDGVIATCIENSIGLVFATTGLSPEQQSRLQAATQKIPLVCAPNMSRAVNLTMKLAEVAAKALAADASSVDVEIIDRHHHFKEDAPSGTALKFGEIIAEQMGQTQHVHGREGRPGRRPPNEIGYHALRVGDNPGEHTIVFAMMGELVELTVRSTNRDCYALGALAAAKFVAGKPPGTYGIDDVLGL